MVVQVEFRLAQRSEPMHPGAYMPAAKRYEDERTLLFHIGQMRQRRVVGVKQT